jgi:hypothetical protein
MIMAVNIETAIAWMRARQGQVSYSMDDRNGPDSYDCSSSIYYALTSAGAASAGWAVNTEYEHDWLKKNGYELITENQPWDAQRGDIFIWGRRGYSSGAGGHTGMFIDSDNIIHCNYPYDGISINDHDERWLYAGRPYYYVYRLTNQASAPSGKDLDTLVKETLAGEYGNGEARKAALGNQYEAVMAVINGKVTTNQKTVDELAQEVIAGKHGNGEARKQSLGSQYDEVQKQVTELLKKQPSEPSESSEVKKPTETEISKTEPIEKTIVSKEEGDLSFNGAVLKKTVLDKILANCKKQNILPSYAITILHFEGLWGTSAVGKADNNWGGMTWTGQGQRPSGVTVTQGSARPSNEGGHYMHYTSVDDFLTDWFYLLRKDGSYKVAGAKTFSDSVKGMFKVGGATYDYAASGFDSYIIGASSRLKAIESENGPLDKFDKAVGISGLSDQIDITIEGIKVTINGTTYELTEKPV